MESQKSAIVTQPRWLKLISRASAWLLLITVAILVVSGWGITNTSIIYEITFGLIDRGVANTIHQATNIPLAVFFLCHVLANIRLLISTKKSALIGPTNILLILVGLGLLAIFILMENHV